MALIALISYKNLRQALCIYDFALAVVIEALSIAASKNFVFPLLCLQGGQLGPEHYSGILLKAINPIARDGVASANRCPARVQRQTA